jgi:hypothetical protein
VRAWLAPRLASVPTDVPRDVPGWLEPARPLEPATPEALCREARECLERAADATRLHGGAFDLLAADAFATWACQAALEVDDPDAALARVVGSLRG